MTVNPTTIQERRNKWANPPVLDIDDNGVFINKTNDVFVAGTPWSRTTDRNQQNTKLSFFGLGLAVMQMQYPDLMWTITNVEGDTYRWAVNDTTLILSEYYQIDVADLDEIYNLQTSGASRQDLNRAMLATQLTTNT